jgi:hypothetical protein
MKTFRQYLQEIAFGGEVDNIRKVIFKAMNRIRTFEPKDVEDSKDMLLSLRDLINDKISGV